MVKDRFVRQVWVSAGIIVASIAIAAWAVSFFSAELSAQADMIVADRQAIQANNDAVANLAQLKTDAPKAAHYQTAINQLLPDQYGLLTFNQWLLQLGATHNVTASMAFQGSVVPSTATTAGTAQFSFSADGAPEDLVAFLNGMNATSSGFLVSLTSFDVVSDGTNEKLTGQGILFFH